MSLSPGTHLSRYRLEKIIGEGGMGIVWRATDSSLGRQVAIKVLPPDFASNEDKVARFRREAKLLASLNHPNIATIHEISEEEGVLFIAMELVEGRTLRRMINERSLRTGEALAIGVEIAEALASAHGSQVIHRDLKPENVIVRPDGHPKVMDFGLARHLGFLAQGPAGSASEAATVSERVTEAGLVIGTVAYMSPEQARGETLDHRSDIFSYGILLYEMLASRPPFDGKSKIDILAAILERRHEPLSDLVPGMPEDVAALVDRCLEKDPAARFATTEELAREVRRIHLSSDDIPTMAAPAPPLPGPAPAAGSRQDEERPTPSGMVRRFRYPHHLLVVLIVAAVLVAGVFLMPTELNPPPEEPGREGVTAGSGKSAGAEPGGGAPELPGHRIVVLPFENLGNPEDEYFAAGMADEITTRLASVAGLQVIATSSATNYAGGSVPLETIRRELGVDYVLEGKIRWASSTGGDDRMRITPKLINAADGSVVWAGIFNESTGDIFSVQTGIATTVIDHLGVALGDGERRAVAAVPTTNLEAYEAYLTGRYYRTRTDYSREGRQRPLGLFQKAVELDPGFVQAWVELARAHAFMFHMGYDRGEERKRLALAAAQRARDLDPDLPEVHLGMGYYHYHVERDYPAAIREFTRAREGLPGSDEVLMAGAYVERRRGRFEEAARLMHEAADLSPRAPGILSQLGQTLVHLDRLEEAERVLRRSITLAPEESYAYLMIVRLQSKRGNLEAARAALESIPGPPDSPTIFSWYLQHLMEGDPAAAMAVVGPEAPEVIEWGLFFYPRDLLAGFARRLLGEEEQARHLFASALSGLQNAAALSPSDPRIRTALGVAYAFAGMKDEAIREGRAGVELNPLSRDAYFGPWHHLDLAWIYALVGKPDAAVAELRRLADRPNEIHFALFDRDPRWASLRGRPGFDSIVEEARATGR